jgi:hypothetical protein
MSSTEEKWAIATLLLIKRTSPSVSRFLTSLNGFVLATRGLSGVKTRQQNFIA